ncbi:MAG: ATP-binding cassette domain-containing protein [Chloroflexota bacterium]|nr:MAG: ATP-binding cassette domain-containing protein [Chloroflexota bacterium]
MKQVQVAHIAKSFGNVEAVRDVTFEVDKGEIFGLLGPNGAGKTTTIRVMLDIFKPDAGTVSILGGPMSEEKKDLIGYMPEERGLYQDIPLERCLVYLATLKGLSANDARRRLGDYLDRFDLLPHKNKKVKELSKGMQQKAQIIAAILHDPELVIIDEPFTSLDPINTQLVKELMGELHEKGVTIIMSTHQMHQVEELSDRILLINEGKNVLYGNLNSIRRDYAGHAVMIKTNETIPDIPSIESIVQHNSATKLILTEGTSPQDVLGALVAEDITLDKFEIALPTLDEIFIKVVKEGSEENNKL